MKKFKLKAGDSVVVIAGANKGQKGEITKVVTDKSRVFISGVNLVSKHTKPSAANPQGGIVKQEAAIHISNVMIFDKSSDSATRVGYRVEDGKKIRFSKKSEKAI
ncbi:MAG: 50S ribosomal protein L24 [Flavobacteriaceae bacterium]|nr:50S ribosomal protein L24 [Flavobacteriaceae bacterium]